MKKKVLVWETLSTVSGGQKMTLIIMDLLRDTYDFCCLIPGKGRMSEELDKRGIPYIIIGDQSLPTGVKGKSVIFRYAAMSIRCIWRSLKAIKEFKPDILYAPGPAALPWSAVCGTLKRKPVIWHIHHVFLDGMTGKLLNMCAKWKCVRKMIGVSAACTDQIKDEKAHAKTAVLYNPINVDWYREGDATRVVDELSEKLGRPLDLENTDVVGHIALIQRPKKQDLTLRVIGNLKRQGRNVAGLFCGEIRDPDFYEELLAIAKEEGISEDVLFLGWRNDVPDIIKCVDVNVCPSTFEGFSLVAQEAAAASVPSIVANVAGVGEFMRLSGSGMLFEADNIEEATKNAANVIDNKEEFGKCGMEYSENWRIEKYNEGIHREFSDVEKFIK